GDRRLGRVDGRDRRRARSHRRPGVRRRREPARPGRHRARVLRAPAAHVTAPLRAVLFDVGDTLVEGWAPTERLQSLQRVALDREFGEREWYERWLAAKLGPFEQTAALRSAIQRAPDGETLRQDTLRWYEDWFRDAAVGTHDID